MYLQIAVAAEDEQHRKCELTRSTNTYTPLRTHVHGLDEMRRQHT
jgi:hypothetical protein